jgi:hypothetical protein
MRRRMKLVKFEGRGKRMRSGLKRHGPREKFERRVRKRFQANLHFKGLSIYFPSCKCMISRLNPVGRLRARLPDPNDCGRMRVERRFIASARFAAGVSDHPRRGIARRHQRGLLPHALTD